MKIILFYQVEVIVKAEYKISRFDNERPAIMSS